MADREFTKVLDWPGYRVYRQEIAEATRRLKLWVRRKRGNRVPICSGCGGKARKGEEVRERTVRDLPWRKYSALAQMGVDEIYLGKKQKFITVVSNLETAELLWFGRERKAETLDRFFTEELNSRQRMRITAPCVDMWEPFRLSIEKNAPNRRIVYDKFHIMKHANGAIEEVRGAEFFRKGPRMRGLVKGKRWLFLTRWMNLSNVNRQELNRLFALNPKLFRAYPLKESLDRLWSYRYEGAMVRYLRNWIDQLRRQRLEPLRKLARTLIDHIDGILNYCRTKVPLVLSKP